jgi:hypothetical protein
MVAKSSWLLSLSTYWKIQLFLKDLKIPEQSEYFNDILADPTVKEIKLDFSEETVENLLSFLYLDRVENLAENAGDLLVAANKVCLNSTLITKMLTFYLDF